MTTLANTFEGGSNTTALTGGSGGNTGGTSGNYFDYASPTVTFSSTHAMHGSLSAEIATTTSATSEMQWHASLTGVPWTTGWFRAYYFFTAFPGVNTRIFNSETNAAGNNGTMWVTTAGYLIFGNTAGSTVLTSGITIPTGAWFRMEGYMTPLTSGASMSMSMWKTSPDSGGTADDVQTSTTAVLGTDFGYCNFGLATATASIGPYWVDDVGVSNTGYLGSSNPGTNAPAGLAAGSSAALAASAAATVNMTIQGA